MVGGGNNDIENSLQNIKKNTLELSFGVFFDGTLNSIANIDERKNYENFLRKVDAYTLIANLDVFVERAKKILDNTSHYESYRSEYTNVARSYKCFKNKSGKIIPIYIEGIGTKPRQIGRQIDFTQDLKEKKLSYDEYDRGTLSLNKFMEDNDDFISCSDDQLASALGVGIFGVKKKVESACEKIYNAIKNINLKKYDELKLDLYVFGFSRGSAAARCFSSCIRHRIGRTKVDCSFKSDFMGVMNITSVKEKLAKENKYRTSLKYDWLDLYFKNPYVCNQIDLWIPKIKVKFLGLYDTVSSYGAYFNDDVEELSLTIDSKNVENVYQICAGDEYRKNFALTDIASAGVKGDSIIIPGSHSDIGGGYSHNMKESLKNFFVFTSGYKGKDMLHNEGGFNSGESERIISNLYSVIPFLLMKDKIVGRDEVFNKEEINSYVLPTSKKLNIDGIWHIYSKELCDFYNKLKIGGYNAYYRIEGDTIKNLSKEELDLSNYVSRMNSRIQYLKLEDAPEEAIKEFEKNYEVSNKKLNEVKQKRSNYDEELLRKIRHDFLHLSAKSKELEDLFVNGSNKNNNRTVIKG